MLSTAYRLVFAATLPIVTDEAYALAVGRSFSLSFFDHPPVGFWLPALAELLTGSDAALVLRLPEIVCGTLSLWILYLIGARLGGPKVAVWTMVLGAVTPALTYAGVLILPDGPLYLGTLGAVYALIRLAQGDDRLWVWFWGGAALALALASKYQAGVLPMSLLVWMAVTKEGRRWLGKPGFYLALAVSLVGILPVIVWNLDHDWASFRFHSGRAGGGFSAMNGTLMLVGQAIYLGPVALALAIRAMADKANWMAPERRLMILIALGPILAFNAIYWFSSGTLAHWSMPGWILLVPLVGVWLARPGTTRATRVALITTTGLIHVLLLVVALQMSSGFLTSGMAAAPAWDRTAPNADLAAIRSTVASSGVLDGAEFVLVENWIQGGHLSAALGPSVAVKVASDAPHHFAFMSGASATGSGVFLGIFDPQMAEQGAAKMMAHAAAVDPAAEFLGEFPISRGGRAYFVLVAVKLSL